MTSNDCALVADRFIRISSRTSSRSRLEIRPERRTSSSSRFRERSRPWLALAAFVAKPLKYTDDNHQSLFNSASMGWNATGCSCCVTIEDCRCSILNRHLPDGTATQTLRMLDETSLRLTDGVEHDVPCETGNISDKFAGPQNRGHVLGCGEKTRGRFSAIWQQ